MAVTVYRSTDSGAPVLSGTVGALVALLDACLVTGYGSKTAAGWSKPFTGTNAAVFRPGSGVRHYLDVNDNGPGSGGAQEARLRGYETMTAVATGTGPFPLLAVTQGVVAHKSQTANATTRAWIMVADDRTFYLFMNGDGATLYSGLVGGEFYSLLAGTDNYRTCVIGGTAETAGTVSSGTTHPLDTHALASGGTTQNGHYVARAYTGLGGAAAFAKLGDASMSFQGGSTSPLLGGTMAIPNPVDGLVWIAPVWVAGVTPLHIRGRMRGFMHFLHTTSFADQDTIAGTGIYAGRTFLLLRQGHNGGVYCLDITGPWDAN